MIAASPAPERVNGAIALLGWAGRTVGPAHFGGVTFWASVTVDLVAHRDREAAGFGAVRDRHRLEHALLSKSQANVLRPVAKVHGCLVEDDDPLTAVRQASLLAGYVPRAVLLPDMPDALCHLVDAAVLDQGVVIDGPAGVQRLANAGPRVPGCGFDAREWEFLEAAYEAWLAADLVRASDGSS